MKTIAEHLAQYAAYHRNRKNVATHLIGIPMIVVGILTLLSRPVLPMEFMIITPASIAVFLSIIFYVRLDIPLGLLMTILLWFALAAGRYFAAMPTELWLSWAIGLFVVGWVFQFIGHYFEGRKPAFVDDIMGLAVGPLFVVTEVVFMLGLRKELKADIEMQLVKQKLKA
ncbi:Mpo1-like protein [Idiomarina sp.]|uniref:Mpo1 family 2-hydroxy fatty acid dioxygenase n=1 Tax=Idiomarina sp. TaxID=1874361 RepID=UPI0026147D0D|nr:Mpo1-like protein [Idiomarina sp.]